MKVAAYQAPLDATTSFSVVGLIRNQVALCEDEGVQLLCCPEAVLGGLADYADSPLAVAIETHSGKLQNLLKPLASKRVATIVGFTELNRNGLLYNSAAVYCRGEVIGIYRKLHPAINKSIYEPGDKTPVFTVGDLTFGILTCRDSSYAEPARIMAKLGATLLFIPTNNGLPPTKAKSELVEQTRRQDIAMAKTNGVSVIRADVAGRTDTLLAYGTSGIVDSRGAVVGSARQLSSDLLIGDIDGEPHLRHERAEA